MELRGKRVLVTGASSGIGADLARELSAAGASLVLSARRVPELEAVAAELRPHGTAVDIVPADLSSPGGPDALARAAGPVDVLVNNAGVDLMSGRPWKDGLADKGDQLLQVNLLAPLRLVNRLLGPMVERGSGALVFISSVAAWSPLPGAPYYTASKAGLAAAAETLRIDLKGTGVRVLTVYPGPIRTEMLDKTKGKASERFFGPLPKGKPDELARRIVDSLLRDERHLVYPSLYSPSRWLQPVGSLLMGLVTPAKKRV